MSELPGWVPVLVWIPLALAWVLAVVDLVRRHDLSTTAKIIWTAVLLIPTVGVFLYFLVRPSDVGTLAAPRAEGRSLRSADPSFVDEIEQAAALRDAGQISAAQYEADKRRILS